MTLPRSTLGTTSLGAVGGARGVAAGGLRILVEFLSTYDSAAVQQLESDLQQLSQQEQEAANRSISAQKAVETSQRRLISTQKSLASEIAKQQNPAAVRREARRIQDIGVFTKAGQAELAILSKSLGPREKITTLLTKEAALKRGLVGLQSIANNREFVRLGILEQQVGVEAQLSAFQRLKAEVPSRLGGLAVGAIGGIVGGAVVGVGFAAAQQVIDAVGEALQDVIDPARHAREAIEDVGGAVADLAKAESITLAEAAVKHLEDLGLVADEATVKLLEQAAAQKLVNDAIKEQIEINQIVGKTEETRTHDIEELRKALVDRARAEGTLTQQRRLVPDVQAFGITLSNKFVLDEFINGVNSLEVATREYDATQGRVTGTIDETARAARDAAAAEAALEAQQRRLAASAALAEFAQQQMADAIRAAVQPQIDAFDTRIASAQSAGPSARTLAIQKQIENLQNASSGGSTRNRELANIAEEKALLLLKQRLRLMGTAINLEEYEGKFLLAAIDAKIAALNKQAAAQDRLNRLLDLQFRASQTLKRQAGESIRDFTERRAQENRDILTEQRDLEREAVIEGLQELRDKTQDAVALQELEERRKSAAVKRGTDDRLKQLQKQLKASQDADRAATAAKVKALEKQREALKATMEKAIEYSTREKNAKIRLAIEAANTVSKLSKLSGEVAGLNAARSFLLALLSSGALSGAAAASTREALNDINNSLRQFSSKLHNVVTGHAVGRGPLEFAQGGIIPLNNSSTPFGANVQFGEQGTEYAVILQHSIAKSLKGMGKGVGQVGPFYMETSNPLKDRYMYKQMVKDAIGEALS